MSSNPRRVVQVDIFGIRTAMVVRGGVSEFEEREKKDLVVGIHTHIQPVSEDDEIVVQLVDMILMPVNVLWPYHRLRSWYNKYDLSAAGRCTSSRTRVNRDLPICWRITRRQMSLSGSGSGSRPPRYLIVISQ